MTDEIRPFQIEVPQEELDDLRRRIGAMRWPEQETVDDESQGVRLATMQELARYWAHGLRLAHRCEARLKALPQFITEIDGVDIHFIHVRSKHDGALPIIVTHGWPGLDHRAAEDHRPADRPRGARRRARRTPSTS